MLLETKNLTKYFEVENNIFNISKSAIKALDNINFSMEENTALGIVGESSSGKSTLAKVILKLIRPTSGEVIYGPGISDLRRDVGIIFQDPFLSLNPKMRIAEIINEPFIIHRLPQDSLKIGRLLSFMKLEKNILTRFPRELSGGQRQRVCIIRALVIKPKLLVLDEPLSSLDIIIQKQILELFLEIKKEFNLSYIFISHNLAHIKMLSSELIVMFQGKIVESGKTIDILKSPATAYTKKLLEAVK